MHHDIWGEVEESDGHPFDATATVRYGSRYVKVGISRDDKELDASMTFAGEVVRDLATLDQRAKRVAAADLRQAYNDGWNEYDEVQEDGSVLAVSNPPLGEPEFEAKLSLVAVNVTGDQTLSFHYDDERMFWGHSVVVTSLKGTDLGEAQAEIVG